MLNLDGKGISISIIEGGRNNNKIVYLDSSIKKDSNIKKKDRYDESDSEDSYSSDDFYSYYVKDRKNRGIEISDDSIKLKDGIFCPYPNNSPDRGRQTLYIAGCSGAGKSTYTSNFLKHWRRLNPKKEIIIFSRVQKDKAFTEKRLNIKKIPIDNDLLEFPIEIEKELSNSLVIFDDINTIKDKKLREEVIHIQDDILETGRHSDIDIICTNHKLMDYKATRTLLNESHYVTFFMGNGSYHNKRFLKEYVGVDKKTIERILNLKSRWVTICQQYPMYCMSENEIFLLK